MFPSARHAKAQEFRAHRSRIAAAGTSAAVVAGVGESVATDVESQSTMATRRRVQQQPPASPGPTTRSQARAAAQAREADEVRAPLVGGGAAAPSPPPDHDARSVALLMVLYTLQGVPMGLSGAVPLLLAGKASYKMQSLFSLASLPFSLKLLWAPFVDAAYVPAWGRRKTWLVPVQLAIGCLMVASRGRIDAWMADDGSEPNVEALTALFFALYFLCATQDIAVDGWALTMLSEARVGWASTCNSVGQTLGFALSYVGFVALHDEATCNKYLRREPAAGGLVSLADFVSLCGWAFLLTTLFVAAGKREGDYGAGCDDGERDEKSKEGHGAYDAFRELKTAYGQALATLKLPPVVGLCAVLLTCKGAFGAADAVTSIRAVEYGMPKEDIALLAPFLLVCSIALPLVIARRTSGARPLDSFLIGVPLRLALNPLIYYLLEYVKYAHGEGGTAADKVLAFRLYAALSAAREVGSNLMFVSQMAFFARVSDPSFGGTYMTLLNTIANLGGKWPPSLALYAVDALKGFGVEDPFLVELAVCTAGGALWFMVFAPRVLALQAIPPSEWRVSAARASTPPPAV